MTISGEIIAILLILLFYLIIYYFIQSLAKPYKVNKFEILELTEKRLIILHISNTLMAVIWISTLEERIKNVGWLIFIYVLITNLLFLAWWFHNYFSFVKQKLRRFSTYIQKRFSLKTNKSLEVPIPDEILKKGKETQNKEFLLDKVNKLKLLNNLLIKRIKELDPDSLHAFPIAEEGRLERLPLINDQTKLKRNVPDDIGSEENIFSFSDNINVFQNQPSSGVIQSNLEPNRDISIGKENFVSMNRSSQLNSPIALIGDIPKKNTLNNRISNKEEGKELLIVEKSVVGRTFTKCFCF